MLTTSAAASEIISASSLLTVQLLCVMEILTQSKGQNDALWPEHARGAGVTCPDPGSAAALWVLLALLTLWKGLCSYILVA